MGAMARFYGLLVTIHLLCAITFVGAVFFEVLVLEPVQKLLPPDAAAKIADAVPRHVVKFMPAVVALLFLSGGAMYWVHCFAVPRFLHTRFGVLLSVKAALALVVLGIFIASIRAATRGTMDPCRFRHTHRVVAVLMLAIVLLAKGMFYF